MVPKDDFYICSTCRTKYPCTAKDKYPEAMRLGLVKTPYCNSCLRIKLLDCRAEILSIRRVVSVSKKVGGDITSYPADISKILSPRDKKIIEEFGGYLSSIKTVLQCLEKDT